MLSVLPVMAPAKPFWHCRDASGELRFGSRLSLA
jgi:hypothetical protein